MNTSVVKVKHVGSVQPAKNGNGSYQTVTVQEYKLISVGSKTIEAATNRIATRNIWSERKQKEGDKIVKADPLFGQLSVGDYVAGHIEQFNTTPYMIDGRECKTYTGLIFEGENKYKYVNNQLKNENAVALDEDGTLTGELVANLKTQPAE